MLQEDTSKTDKPRSDAPTADYKDRVKAELARRLKLGKERFGNDTAIRSAEARLKEDDMTQSARNILDATINGGPSDVKTAIEAAIVERIAGALEDKKTQVARNLVGIEESYKELEPSVQKNSEKAAGAKKVAVNKIKDKAKNEGHELTDEQATTILEELLAEEPDENKVTIETLEHVLTWFTEEELKEASNDEKREARLAKTGGSDKDRVAKEKNQGDAWWKQYRDKQSSTKKS